MLVFKAIIDNYEMERDFWTQREGEGEYAKYFKSYTMGDPLVINPIETPGKPETSPYAQYLKLPKSLEEALIALKYVKLEEFKPEKPVPVKEQPSAPILFSPNIPKDQNSLTKELATQKDTAFTMDEFPYFQQYLLTQKDKIEKIYEWITQKYKKDAATANPFRATAIKNQIEPVIETIKNYLRCEKKNYLY